VLTSPDVADDAELAECVHRDAHVLETLRPDERVVFVLPEVFDVPYDEIRSEHEQVVARLVAALNTGDLHGLVDVLAPDVIAVADGGGKVREAAWRPVVGAERLAWCLVGGMAKTAGALCAVATWVNGQPAVRMELDGRLVGVASITVEGGRVTRVYSIANPDKLGRLDAEADVGGDGGGGRGAGRSAGSHACRPTT
jgi:RNA polymerase sigma-70 factor (ECF subfamily)